jgi:hypothetical protein
MAREIIAFPTALDLTEIDLLGSASAASSLSGSR